MKLETLSPSILILLAACGGGIAGGSQAQNVANSDLRTNGRGRVFTLTNETGGNRVLELVHAPDGALDLAGAVVTGGNGTDAGLGSQGAVVLSGDRRWLIAVNAGSNDLALLKVRSDAIEMSDLVASGGDMPVSVAEHEGLVYALNAGHDQSIAGFRITAAGKLDPIAGSKRALSATTAVGAAQIQFMPNGSALIVTEKATNRIDSFAVRADGTTEQAITIPSAGMTPFGFDIDARGTIVVSDAFGAQAAQGAMSSYRLDETLAPQVISGSVADAQTAPCWVAITSNGRWAYTTNARSNSISAYALDARGAITLLATPEGTTATGAGPIDMAFSGTNRFLYVLENMAHAVEVFEVDANTAGLTPVIGGVIGLPLHAVGLAAL